MTTTWPPLASMPKALSAEHLSKRHATVLADLLMKVEAEDWHGVQDCASDLREIEAMRRVLVALRVPTDEWGV